MSSQASSDDLRAAGGPPPAAGSDPAPPPAASGSEGGTSPALRLVRASQLTGLPVVTFGGDHDVEIKDVVFDQSAGGLTGFTLRKPGLLGGPQKHVLVVADVQAIGPDAVMIQSHSVFKPNGSLSGDGDNVIGDRIMTDDGTELGTVADVVVSVQGGEADIVGFEVQAAEGVKTGGDNVFIPLPAALAMSGEAIVVPASTKKFVSQDYTGFGASVQAFRDQLETS